MRKLGELTLRLMVWLLIVGTLVYASGCPVGRTGPPAPLLKRKVPSASPAPPYFSTMIWASGRFRTTFAPDGSYQADNWRGFWSVRRDAGRLELHVRERASDESGWYEWKALMVADMMGGRLFSESGPALSFEVGGRPDQ